MYTADTTTFDELYEDKSRSWRSFGHDTLYKVENHDVDNLLVVEDQMAPHQILDRAIKSVLGNDFGYDVAQTRNDVKTLLDNRESYDLVLLDNRIPTRDGGDPRTGNGYGLHEDISDHSPGAIIAGTSSMHSDVGNSPDLFVSKRRDRGGEIKAIEELYDLITSKGL